MDDTISMKKMHAYLHTRSARNIGKISEDFILNKDISIEKGFCLQSKELPL